MSLNNKITIGYNFYALFISFTASILIWFFFTLLDFFVFNPKNLGFFEILFIKVEPNIIVMRLFIIIFCLIFAVIISKSLIKSRNLQNILDYSAQTIKTLKKINQIILFENDIKILIEKSCDILTQTGGFNSVWFIDSNGDLLVWSEKDSRSKFNEVKNFISPKNPPECINQAFITKKPFLKSKNKEKCTKCPLYDYCQEFAVALTPLVFNNNIYGILGVGAEIEFHQKQDSFKLMEEVAEDLALALHSIESESYKKEMKEKWSKLIKTTTDAVISTDIKGIITGWNPGAEKMTGYKEDEVIGKPIDLIEPVEDIKKNRKYLIYAFHIKDTKPYETEIITKAGKIVPVEISFTFELDSSGKPKGVSGILRDIKERKLNEKILAQTRERLELAMDAGEHGFWDWNLISNEIYFSPGFFTMLGYKPDNFEMEIDSWFNLIHPDDKKNVIPKINDFISQAMHHEFEFRMRSATGKWKWISSRVKTFEKDSNDMPLRVVGVHIDLTQIKNSQKHLQEINERLDLVIKGTNAGLWDWNVQTGETVFNERWAQMAGYTLEELQPTSINTWINLCHPGDLKLSNEAMKRHFNDETSLYKCQIRVKHKKGHFIWVQARGKLVAKDNSGNPLRVTGTYIDITEIKEEEIKREKLEQQLRQSQKMEAVGQLAGGIAHDFNNILQVILGYSELLLDISVKDSSQSEFINEISNSITKAAELTSQLLAFSRQQVLKSKTFNLNSSIKFMAGLISRSIGDHIALKYSFSTEKIYIFADPRLIEQSLMNICINAADAMDSGGKIFITTKVCTLNESKEEQTDEIPPGEYAQIEVEDTGKGINQEALPHIYEPFFSTKEKKSGLGLSTVYGIVKQHKGFIKITSQEEKGTIVKLFFPLIRPEEIEEEIPKIKPIPKGSKTVLIAEDDDTLSVLIEKILKNAGYDTIIAKDGFEAVEKGRNRIQDLSILFLDVLMPQKGGEAVYNELSALKPGIPVLFSSGYNKDFSHTYFLENNNRGFIQKPFSSKTLLSKIEEILEVS